MGSMSTKQKCNTTSSTTAEINAVSDSLPYVMWHKRFLADQKQSFNGIPIGRETVMQQDNQAAIKMEEYGKASCSKRTRHLDIKYFYITNHIKNGNIRVEYCPSKKSTADYMTKAVQGSLFVKFQNRILGLDDEDIRIFRGKFEKEYNCSNMICLHPHGNMG